MITYKQIKKVIDKGDDIRISEPLKKYPSDYVRLIIMRDFIAETSSPYLGGGDLLVIEVEEPTGKTIYRKRLIIERYNKKELMKEIKKAEEYFTKTKKEWELRG